MIVTELPGRASPVLSRVVIYSKGLDENSLSVPVRVRVKLIYKKCMSF